MLNPLLPVLWAQCQPGTLRVLPKLAAAMTKITTGLLPYDYADLALH